MGRLIYLLKLLNYKVIFCQKSLIVWIDFKVFLGETFYGAVNLLRKVCFKKVSSNCHRDEQFNCAGKCPFVNLGEAFINQMLVSNIYRRLNASNGMSHSVRLFLDFVDPFHIFSILRRRKHDLSDVDRKRINSKSNALQILIQIWI